MWIRIVCWEGLVGIAYVWMWEERNEIAWKIVPPPPIWPTVLMSKEKEMELQKAPFKYEGAGSRPLCWQEQRWRKGAPFLSLWRLFPYRLADSQGIIPLHFGRLWVEKRILGFFACLGFLFLLEVEVKQKQAAVRGKCSVNVSYCGPAVVPNEFRDTCSLVLAVECEMEFCHVQKQRLQNGSLGSVLDWGENFLFCFISPSFVMSANANSWCSSSVALRTDVLVMFSKGNLSSIQHVGIPCGLWNFHLRW